MDVNFFGGEPLMAFGLMRDLVAYADARAKEQRKAITYAVTTNGTLVTEEIVDFLKENRLRVILSVDGKAETHDIHRRTITGRGSFEKVEPALRTMKAAQLLPSVRMTLAPDVVDRLAENVFHFWGQGFTGIDVALVVEAEWEAEQVKSFEQRLFEVGESVAERVTAGEYVHLNLINDTISRIRSGGGLSLCAAGRTSIGVAPDGSIYPCHRFAGTGDCRLGHVESGIDAERRAAFLSVPEPSPRCQGCPARHVCTRGCPAKNLELTGKLFEAPATTCRLERIKAKVAEKVLSALGME